MTWVAIVAVGLGSFAFRLGPLLLFQRISLSERGNRLVRQGGMSAIVALIVVSTRNEATGSVAVPTILAVAAGTVLLFGFAPAWRATRVDPQTAMKSGGRGVVGGDARHRLGRALVVGQVALSLAVPEVFEAATQKSSRY